VIKLEHRGLHGHLIDAIGERIVTGQLSPGSPLPSESELCSMFGVSRTALREALRVIAAKGLVEAKPKIGTLVRAAEHWNYLDADVMAWRLNTEDSDNVIAELYELRHLIEPLAATLAATNAKSKDIEQIREAYREMEAAADDGERIIEPDLKFHRAIIGASGNKLFSSLAHVISAALSINFRIVSNTPRGQVHSIPVHKKVLDAIVDRDRHAARLAMQRLIEDSERDARAVCASASHRRSKKFHKAARAR
jgi:DNA-binding FadR family transcriptional regulator